MATSCSFSASQNVLTISFIDQIFTFHAQWLYDTRCDGEGARDSKTAFSQTLPTARIKSASISHARDPSSIVVTWMDESQSEYPTPWLRVMAPLVAKREPAMQEMSLGSKGWTPESIHIPEYHYQDLFHGIKNSKSSQAVNEQVITDLLVDSSSGIVKIIGLPEPNLKDEKSQENTLVTAVLKHIFGAVFVHPRRAADTTFNVSSQSTEENPNPVALPNYHKNPVLLPHSDHAHYSQAARIMGLYQAEGVSLNTFVSGWAALQTLKEESPHLAEPLQNAPVAVGRLAPYYNPPLNQSTVATAIAGSPIDLSGVMRFRWHPHLFRTLLSSFDDFETARASHHKFQDIMTRDTHLLKLMVKPGDMYLWDNYRILHGRESILEVPRTAVGQTVPEDVVMNRYREILLGRLRGKLSDDWLTHTPTMLLREMILLMKG